MREIDCMTRELARLNESLGDFRQTVLPMLRTMLERIEALQAEDRPPRSKLLTVKEAASYLRVSDGTISQLVHLRELRRTRIGRCVRFHINELDRYIDRKTRHIGPRG